MPYAVKFGKETLMKFCIPQIFTSATNRKGVLWIVRVRGGWFSGASVPPTRGCWAPPLSPPAAPSLLYLGTWKADSRALHSAQSLLDSREICSECVCV